MAQSAPPPAFCKVALWAEPGLLVGWEGWGEKKDPGAQTGRLQRLGLWWRQGNPE